MSQDIDKIEVLPKELAEAFSGMAQQAISERKTSTFPPNHSFANNRILVEEKGLRIGGDAKSISILKAADVKPSADMDKVTSQSKELGKRSRESKPISAADIAKSNKALKDKSEGKDQER